MSLPQIHSRKLHKKLNFTDFSTYKTYLFLVNKDRSNEIVLLSVIIIFVVLIGLWLFFESSPGHKQLKNILIKRLTRTEQLQYNSNALQLKKNNVIYVLGGTQYSLTKKFQTAAKLYHLKLSKRILILNKPGITEYDPSLGRNLTNDEWARKELVALGIDKDDIEFIKFKQGFLGTVTEVRGISDLAARRGYNHVILVTSQYHTARTWITVSKMFEHQNITAYLYAADEPVSLSTLLYEYFKLVLYKNIVLLLYVNKNKILSEGPSTNTSFGSMTIVDG